VEHHVIMNTVFDIGSLTRAEKLQAMEQLWEALTRSADDYPSPAWHADVLGEREEALKAGKDEFVPWEEAKRVLRERAK
jgi:putative addiction module component (TIGR02574 family)